MKNIKKENTINNSSNQFIKQSPNLSQIYSNKSLTNISEHNTKLNHTNYGSPNNILYPIKEANYSPSLKRRSLRRRSTKQRKSVIRADELISLPELGDIPLSTVIQLIQKDPTKRQFHDLLCINTFLVKTDIYQRLKIETNNNIMQQNELIKIFIKCAKKLKFLAVTKDEVLYKINEESNFFYFIIKGKINAMKIYEEKVLLSGFDYFKFLFKLYKEKEFYLIEKTIEKNNDMFPINKNEINEMNLIIFCIIIEDYYLNEKLEIPLSSIFEDCFIDIIKDFNIKIDLSNSKNNSNNSEVFFHKYKNEILKKMPKYDEKTKNKFKPFVSIKNKAPIKIYKYYSFLVKGPFTTFGDYSLDDDNKRNETIKATENIELCYLEKNDYVILLKNEIRKYKLKEALFLKDNFIFRRTSKKFEARYFHYFIYEELEGGMELFQQNTNSEYVYFLNEGTIELSINMNTKELLQIINKLQLLKKGYKNSEISQISPREKIKKNLKEIPDQRKIIKILLMQDIECIGLLSFYHDINNFYTAKVTSKSAKLYKITKVDLLNIISVEKSANEYLINEVKRKIDTLLSRLYNLKEVKKFLIKRINKENEPIQPKNSNTESKKRTKNLINIFNGFKKIYDSYDENIISFTNSNENTKQYQLKTLNKFNFNFRNQFNNNINKYNTNYDNKVSSHLDSKENPNNNFKYGSYYRIIKNQKKSPKLMTTYNKSTNKLKDVSYNKEKFPLLPSQKKSSLYGTTKNNQCTKLIIKARNLYMINKNISTKNSKFKNSIKLHKKTSSIKYEESLLGKLQMELKIDSVIRLIPPQMKINKSENKNLVGKNTNNYTFVNNGYTLTESNESYKKILNKSKD